MATDTCFHNHSSHLSEQFMSAYILKLSSRFQQMETPMQLEPVPEYDTDITVLIQTNDNVMTKPKKVAIVHGKCADCCPECCGCLVLLVVVIMSMFMIIYGASCFGNGDIVTCKQQTTAWLLLICGIVGALFSFGVYIKIPKFSNKF